MVKGLFEKSSYNCWGRADRLVIFKSPPATGKNIETMRKQRARQESVEAAFRQIGLSDGM